MRGIEKSHISNLKALKAPPQEVINILAAMVITLGYSEYYIKDFSATKKAMADVNTFMSGLLNYDLHGISEENFLLTKRILRDISEDRARQVSDSAYLAFKWVRTIHEYQSKSIQFILTQQQIKERLQRNTPLYEAIKEEQG